MEKWYTSFTLLPSYNNKSLTNHNYNLPSFSINTPNDNKRLSNIHNIIHLLQLISIFTSQEQIVLPFLSIYEKI